MKIKTIVHTLLVLLLISAGGIVAVRAQADQVVGGYSSVSARSGDAKRAADLAVRTRSSKTGKKITLVKIVKAEQQVVAGMNYRVCLLVREGRHKPYTATAVVYQNLKNRRSLTRWKKGECTEL